MKDPYNNNKDVFIRLMLIWKYWAAKLPSKLKEIKKHYYIIFCEPIVYMFEF